MNDITLFTVIFIVLVYAGWWLKKICSKKKKPDIARFFDTSDYTEDGVNWKAFSKYYEEREGESPDYHQMPVMMLFDYYCKGRFHEWIHNGGMKK